MNPEMADVQRETNSPSLPPLLSCERQLKHCLLGTTPKLPQRKGELKRKAAPEVTLFFSLAGFLVALSVQRLTCISLSLSPSLRPSVHTCPGVRAMSIHRAGDLEPRHNNPS